MLQMVCKEVWLGKNKAGSLTRASGLVTTVGCFVSEVCVPERTEKKAFLLLLFILFFGGYACGSTNENGSAPPPLSSGPSHCGGTDVSREVGPYIWAFTDQAYEAGIVDRTRRNKGIAAADVDLDGDVDLYLTNSYDGAVLYLNNGDGTFNEQANQPNVALVFGGTFGDYDNDGDPDLFIACGGFTTVCENGMYRNDGIDPDSGEIIFTDVTLKSGVTTPTASSTGGAWGDYDNDGLLDIFSASVHPVEETGGTTRDALYRNLGDGSFEEIAVSAGVGSEEMNGQGVWFDYDTDGDLDLYVPGFYSNNVLFENKGDGTFVDSTPFGMASEPWRAAAAVADDFDNDGYVDLLVLAYTYYAEVEDPVPFDELHPRDYRFYLYKSDGQGGMEDISEATGLREAGEKLFDYYPTSVVAVDFNLDGYLDIAISDGRADNYLYSAVPDEETGIQWVNRSTLIRVAPEDPPEGEPYPEYPYDSGGIVAIDYDCDHDLDIYIGNGGKIFDPNSAEPNRLFRNDGPRVGHFIYVDAVGTTVNRDAIGALVRVSDGPEGDSTWAVYRSVYRSLGLNCSQARVLQIGVGEHEGPYHVSITWPGGGVDTLNDVPHGGTARMIQSP